MGQFNRSNQYCITRFTELTRRKQRTNSQYPVEHVNDRIEFMGFSPTTVSYVTTTKWKIDIFNDDLVRENECKKKWWKFVLPPSHLRKYCRCYWVNKVLNIGSNRSIVVAQPVELLHVKNIHSKRLSAVWLAECYYTHNLLFVIASNWFAFKFKMDFFFVMKYFKVNQNKWRQKLMIFHLLMFFAFKKWNSINGRISIFTHYQNLKHTHTHKQM